MYIIQKQGNFSDSFEIRANDGDSLRITYTLKISSDMIRRFRALQVRIAEIEKQRKAHGDSAELAEQLGEVIVELYTLVFGEENTQALLAFYESDYVAMIVDIFPYIQNVVVPELSKYAKSRKKQLLRAR